MTESVGKDGGGGRYGSMLALRVVCRPLECSEGT